MLKLQKKNFFYYFLILLPFTYLVGIVITEVFVFLITLFFLINNRDFQLDKSSNYKYFTPIDSIGKDEVLVSRIRQDNAANNILNFWIVSDNLKKGAALNAVQIAEKYIEYYL